GATVAVNPRPTRETLACRGAAASAVVGEVLRGLVEVRCHPHLPFRGPRATPKAGALQRHELEDRLVVARDHDFVSRQRLANELGETGLRLGDIKSGLDRSRSRSVVSGCIHWPIEELVYLSPGSIVCPAFRTCPFAAPESRTRDHLGTGNAGIDKRAGLTGFRARREAWRPAPCTTILSWARRLGCAGLQCFHNVVAITIVIIAR